MLPSILILTYVEPRLSKSKRIYFAQKNILVIICIDLRLTDNLMGFLNFDNLQNRYDHFALAGTSLLCCPDEKEHFAVDEESKENYFDKYKHWKATLIDHIKIAQALHEIKDVYIVEHQNCGAYSEFLKKDFQVGNEEDLHRHFASHLADEIYSLFHLNTHCFFIDLRGNVKLIYNI